MLHLASRTPPSWARWALAHLDDLLLDHAHCEKKAASTAINLIFKYGGEHPALAQPLSALAREELEHFEQVIAHLRRRGKELVRAEPSPYAAELMKICRRGEPARMIDTLLCCAMIEARSCERMQHVHTALSAAVDAGLPSADPALAGLYGSLLTCEARHHTSYVELARGAGELPEADVRARLLQIAAHEAEVVARLPVGPRLHDAAPP